MNIKATNINELYLMSAVLSSSVIFSAVCKDDQLVFKAAISINHQKFMGSIVVNNIAMPISVEIQKLEFLSFITISSAKQIEITTSGQIISCPIHDIDLSFSYDEDLHA